MEPPRTRIAVVLVDHQFQALSRRFLVRTTSDDEICDLKKKVKETKPIYFSRLTFDLADLAVWKPMGELVINISNSICMAEILGAIKDDDKDTIRPLEEDESVADLGLSRGETLLVQLPFVHDSAGGDLITTDVDPEYACCFLKVNTKGDVTESDLIFNSMYDDNDGGAPKFVTDHEGIVSQKRKLSPEMHVLAEKMLDEGTFTEYFCSAEEFSESIPTVNLPELQHLVLVSSVDAQWWRTLNPENAGFQDSDAYWLLFSALTKYYETITPTDDHSGPIITVKQGLESWSFHLLIEVDRKLYSYRPKSDFLLLKYGLPRLAVEVDRPCVDILRLMLQGASIVRFANTKLDAYKKEKNFVFVAIFIHSNGQVDRYLLYQDEKRDLHNVYMKHQMFELAVAEERMRFALELYNLPSTWHTEEDTKEQVDKLQLAMEKKSRNLPTFTGGSKRLATDTAEVQT